MVFIDVGAGKVSDSIATAMAIALYWVNDLIWISCMTVGSVVYYLLGQHKGSPFYSNGRRGLIE